MVAFDLDTPLVQFSSNEGNAKWTMRHAVEGVQIFGGIGSGKTSGSGRLLAYKYLAHGFGGLVLTVKPDEKLLWEKYCADTGRSDDLIIIEPNGKYHFNFLAYESTVSESNDAITENIVEVLKTVIRAGEDKDGGKNDDAFWETALDMLMFNIIDLCKLAYGSLSVEKMYAILQSLPKLDSEQEKPSNDKGDVAPTKKQTEFDKAYYTAYARIEPLVSEWYKALSLDEKLKIQDEDAYNEAACEQFSDLRLLKHLYEFFFESFKNLSTKTRSIVEFIFSGFLFRLLREPVFSLFCKNISNIVPDDCLKGKIILINLPVKKYHKVGRDCQILFKYIWQRAMEKRQVDNFSKPVFLWADEAQNFLHEHDADYQATARSSRIATVYITQNLPNYYASMGGHKGEYRVKSFLGTLGTKFFHANADIETNKYASELIGDGVRDDISKSVTIGSESVSQSENRSLKLDRLVRPEEFMRLQTGGPNNDSKVEGYVHVQGNQINKNRNHKKMKFNQNFIP